MFNMNHLFIDSCIKIIFHIQYISNSTAHTGCEVLTCFSDNNYASAGHILTSMITDTLNDCNCTGVSDCKTLSCHTVDKCFTATIESLIELVSECASKRPKKSSPAKGVTINSQRKLGYCEFCGNLTEYSKLISEISEFVANDNEFPVHEKQVLSHRYCSDHRPKLINGLWNPKYRQGKRSLEQFNKELIRLRRQCAKPHKANANTGDILIDTYFHEWIQGQTLTPADLDKLRNIARRMVDSKLTDTKKKIIILKHQGFNQFETAQVLEKNHYTTMTKQAVSKALASVRKEFYI